MKHSYLKHLLLCLCLSIGTNAFAYDAKIDGIYYNFSGDEATVTYKQYKNYNYTSDYSGTVIIPESVTYNNKTYGVTSIGDHAFTSCNQLTSVVIPNSILSIGDGAFSGCVNLSALSPVTIPNSVISIGEDVFYNCISMSSIVVEEGNPVYDSRNNCKAIIETATNTLVVGCKNTIIPNSVTSIGDHAFYGCKRMVSITIPNSVTSIGDYAFRNCSALTSVTIPNSVTSIGRSAFSGCSGLTSVTIGNGVTSIGSNAFDYCSGLKKVIVPDIAAWCAISFGNSYANPLCLAHHLYSDETTEITDLIIPNRVTSIGHSAFPGCSGMTSITIPNSVTSIGWYAFENCSGLTSVTIPNSVISISGCTFSDCSNLSSIEVEEGNPVYDSRNGCNAIINTATNTLVAGCKNTTIPNSVTSIGERAFYECSGLTSINIPNSVTSIDGAAFWGCTGLVSIIIPNGVTSIGSSVFYGCSSLTSVTIPNSVTSINIQAFLNCSSLTSVKVRMESPITISSTVFSNRANATLTVPYGSKDAYEAADYWREFKEIVEKEGTDITIGSAGLATYCSGRDLDFSDVSGEVDAYIANEFDSSTYTLTLTRVTEVPAGEGLYLVGGAGTYNVPYTTTGRTYSNLLKGVTTATTISPTDGDYTNFILANGKHGVAFYSLSESGELAAGKAYLQLPTASVSEVKAISVIFNEDEDAIQNIEEDSQTQRIYNLQGQQVNALKSGLYIINGKKVFIK